MHRAEKLQKNNVQKSQKRLKRDVGHLRTGKHSRVSLKPVSSTSSNNTAGGTKGQLCGELERESDDVHADCQMPQGRGEWISSTTASNLITFVALFTEVCHSMRVLGKKCVDVFCRRSQC